MNQSIDQAGKEFDETMVEDWLDADSHSGRLPSKFNFSDLQLIGKLLNPNIKQFLSKKLEEQAREFKKCVPAKRPEWIEAYDNDGHRYQIPSDKREEWYKWCELDPEDEASWDEPSFAERIDGLPVTDNSKWNQAISEMNNNIEERL